jgi:hypothetical protein
MESQMLPEMCAGPNHFSYFTMIPRTESASQKRESIAMIKIVLLRYSKLCICE